MSEETPRMGWRYPSKDEDNFYVSFETLVQEQDASAFAAREDRNEFLTGGGVFTFNAGTGLLTWSAEILGLNPTTGAPWFVSSGSLVLADGQYGYINLARGNASQSVLTPVAASALPQTDEAFALCLRVGSLVYFRSGRVIASGESGPVLSASSLFTPVAVPAPFGDGGLTAVCDAVYISGSDAVTKARANAGATLPCVGFVSAKPTVNTAALLSSGELGGFVGLTPGAKYYVSPGLAGAITATPTTTAGEFLQRVGIARNATTLLIQLGEVISVL